MQFSNFDDDIFETRIKTKCNAENCDGPGDYLPKIHHSNWFLHEINAFAVTNEHLIEVYRNRAHYFYCRNQFCDALFYYKELLNLSNSTASKIEFTDSICRCLIQLNLTEDAKAHLKELYQTVASPDHFIQYLNLKIDICRRSGDNFTHLCALCQLIDLLDSNAKLWTEFSVLVGKLTRLNSKSCYNNNCSFDQQLCGVCWLKISFAASTRALRLLQAVYKNAMELSFSKEINLEQQNHLQQDLNADDFNNQEIFGNDFSNQIDRYLCNDFEWSSTGEELSSSDTPVYESFSKANLKTADSHCKLISSDCDASSVDESNNRLVLLTFLKKWFFFIVDDCGVCCDIKLN